jgi:hypothetical protein
MPKKNSGIMGLTERIEHSGLGMMNNSITRNGCLGGSAQGAPGAVELGHVAQVFATTSCIPFASFPSFCSGIFRLGVCGPLRLSRVISLNLRH